MLNELIRQREQTGQFTKSVVEKASYLKKGVKASSMTALEWVVTRPLSKKIARAITPFVAATATDLTVFDYTEFDQFDEQVNPENTQILLVTSHFSHQEGTALVELSSKVRTRFPFIKRVGVPVSQTLYDGRQGVIGQTVYKEMGLPNMEANDVYPIYVYTENDKLKRNAEPNRDEMETILKDIRNAVEDNSTALAVFAGGTVEPGRHKKDGTVNGLGLVTDAFIPRVLSSSTRSHKDLLIIPVGVSGTYRILSADRILPTKKSFWNLIKRRFGLPVEKLAEIRVGRPFFVGPDINKANINDFVMRTKVAPLVWEQDQGVYKPTA